MQMFGIGILELMVILLLTVIVVGPDRLPAVAADLAKWIRQGRAYARHVMGDFNSVVSELEKEANVSREDWKEIGSVLNRHTGDIGKELNKVTRDIEDSGDLDKAKAEEPSNVVSIDGSRNGESTEAKEAAANGTNGEAPAETDEEKPWYVPEKPRRASRRRTTE
jgi:sec-independent protein translocase protein TatB